MNSLNTAGFDKVTPAASVLPNVSWFTDKHGKIRWRYRKAGQPDVALGTDFGSPEFLRRYHNACNGISLSTSPKHGRPSAAPKNSLSAIVDGWYQSPHFTGLSKGTRAGYRRRAENLRERYGHHSVKTMRVQAVADIIQAKADRPNEANTDRRVLCFVLDQAVALGMVDTNVARQTKRLPVSSKGFHIWTEEEVGTYLAFHAQGSLAWSTMVLMLYTGASRRDVVEFGPNNVIDGQFKYVRRQRGDRPSIKVDTRIHPTLQACIDSCMASAPDHTTFLQTQQGSPRSPAGLGNSMRQWCDEVGLKQCTSHGLRKAYARRLAQAHATEQEMSSVLGYADTTIPHGIRGMGNRTTLADTALSKLQSPANP